jgi:hypothetical protein
MSEDRVLHLAIYAATYASTINTANARAEPSHSANNAGDIGDVLGNPWGRCGSGRWSIIRLLPTVHTLVVVSTASRLKSVTRAPLALIS